METTINLKNGNKLEIYQDNDSMSPREWDNIAEFHFFHKRYNIGDKTDINSEYYESWADMAQNAFLPSDIVMPVYCYSKRVLRLSLQPFTCPWDSGQIGFAVIPVSTIVREYGEDTPENRIKAVRCLKAELETYDQFLNDEVYGYVLTDSEGIELDSCFGFYGYDPTTNGIFDTLDIG